MDGRDVSVLSDENGGLEIEESGGISEVEGG